MSELTRYVTELGGKAKEAETLRKSLKEYTDLVKKQSEVISSFPGKQGEAVVDHQAI